LTKTIFCRT